ncbi:hypothetical protein OG735_21710 [Streptomyces sp. NBC_01210]|uniref:hypothetical protein n=1 Tax=Streptomyces sp. NBC_01210 TaxID=2903774 RepID=UPI002E0FCE1E|nr:hypothetical protein OG735_21710 [Streptomyces sp. NBC_01210]
MGRGQLPVTQAIVFSGDETTDVGHQSGSPVTPDQPARGNDFTGEIRWVQIDVDAAAATRSTSSRSRNAGGSP